MKILNSSTLHKIRVVISRVPGGVLLISFVFQMLGFYQERKRCKIMQSCGLLICGEVHKIFSSAGISYWADHGTLLGLIRENRPLPYDPDMDYSIPQTESLAKVYRALVAHGFVLAYGYAFRGKITEITMIYRGISIDFFKCHVIDGDLGHYCFVTSYDKATGNFVDLMAHERKRPMVRGPVVRTFGSPSVVQVSVPENADEILTATYGNWRVPDRATDFCSDKIPSQYRDVHEGCKMLSADELVRAFDSGLEDKVL